MSPEQSLRKVDTVQNRTPIYDSENERSTLDVAGWISSGSQERLFCFALLIR